MGNRMVLSCGLCDAALLDAYICTSCKARMYTTITRAGVTYEDDYNRTIVCMLDDLDVQICRQSRMTAGRFGGRSAETPIPFDGRAAKAHANLSDVLTTWARHYGAASRVLNGPRACARWLRDNLDSISRTKGAESMQAAIDAALKRALNVIDRLEAKDYIGVCSALTDGGACPVDLYAMQGEAFMTCPHCGASHDVQERRGIMLNAVGDVLLNAVDTVRIVSTYGHRITTGQVYKWKFRGRLISQGSNAKGQPMYRLGDVLALVLQSC